ncbi:MAG: hypothetical protein HY911_13820 [Desulfobacterales bacterium]|nr:hypothetical protein [Desulfobacterales bacterium]
MKMRAPLVLILLFLLLNVATGAQALPENGELSVLGIGTSKVRAEGMAAGREAALQAALNMAVFRALTDVVSPEAMAGQFQAINETVLNRTDQFVRDYKVLTDATVGDTYRVVVQATVVVGRLKESLKAGGVRMGQRAYPQVLVCVAERRAGVLAPVYWWRGRTEVIENISQTALSKALADAGFPLAQPAAVALGAYPPELGDADAVALGRQFQAEVVVTGAASADETGSAPAPGSGYRAVIALRALRVADSRQIALAQKEITAADPSGDGREALGAVALQAGQELAAQIGQTWFKQAAAESRLEVVVKGVGGKIANFVKFRGALSALPGVDNVLLKTMMPDQAILTLSYQGTARSLADAILAQNFQSFTVTMEGVYPEAIQVTIVPR